MKKFNLGPKLIVVVGSLLSFSLVRCSDHGGLLFGPGGLARGGSRPFGTGRRLGLLGLRGLLPRQRLQKLRSCRLEVKSCRLHPGVCADLVDLGSHVAIVAEKLEDEVLELPAEPRAVDFLEVGVMLALQEQVIEVFLLASLLEWEDALHDNEEDDANGEHVDILSLVCLALLDLWCHVGHGAAVAVQRVDVLVAGEAKISQFQVQLIVDQDVFKLEVPVDNSAVVHVLN